jgi:hypothetical protein
VGAAESRHVSEAADLPAIVFAPARPVFSSLGRLTAALGPDQPWVTLEAGHAAF